MTMPFTLFYVMFHLIKFIY